MEVNADVSTVTAAADKVLHVYTNQGDFLQHIDFQSGPDASLPRRSHCYNALLEERHELPVESVVVLMRPEANLKAINGLYRRWVPGTTRAVCAIPVSGRPRLGIAGGPSIAKRSHHAAVGPN